MTDLRKAAEMALEVFDGPVVKDATEHAMRLRKACDLLRQALAQPEQKTPLKVLNLTVFTENRLRNGRVYDVETLQAMTSRDILAIPDMGKKALKEVLEALDVYAVNMNQERVDETVKREHDPEDVWQKALGNAFVYGTGFVRFDSMGGISVVDPKDYHYLEKKEWVGLTDEEIHEVASKKWWDWEDAFDIEGFSRAIEAKLKEKNNG